MTVGSAAAPTGASYWNDAGGRAWVELQALIDRMHAPIATALVMQADPGAGGRVLDVGCGAGATTLEMARRLGPAGRCVGTDVSAPLLALARRRSESEGVDGADFVEGDAQSFDFGEGAFDAVMSRFGVMFFDDFDAAFANLRRSVRPGGSLAFACWRSPADNPLSQVPMEAAAPFLPELPRPAPDAPGRFAFADPERVRGVLDRSGWREVEIAPLDTPSPLSFEEAMTLSMRLGPLATAMEQQGEEVRTRVCKAVGERIFAYAEDGVVPMTAACWMVTARR